MTVGHYICMTCMKVGMFVVLDTEAEYPWLQNRNQNRFHPISVLYFAHVPESSMHSFRAPSACSRECSRCDQILETLKGDIKLEDLELCHFHSRVHKTCSDLVSWLYHWP